MSIFKNLKVERFFILFYLSNNFENMVSNVQGDSNFTARSKTPIYNRLKILKKFRNDSVSL
jgi:hypothetical protein